MSNKSIYPVGRNSHRALRRMKMKKPAQGHRVGRNKGGSSVLAMVDASILKV